MKTCAFKRTRGALAAALCLCGWAQARTVALWPLDYDTNGSFDGRCAVDPRFDLAAVAANVANLWNDVPWNLPPNPDGARTAFPPTSVDYFPCGDLRIGSTDRPLLGEVDLWRLTEGALAAEDLLWAKPKGLVILVR